MVAVLKVGISIALVAAAVTWVGVDALGTAARALPASAFAAACALVVLQTAVLGFRWRRVMVAIGAPLAAAHAGAVMYAGVFFNQLLPSSFGGDAIRIWELHRAGYPTGVAVRGVLLDRVSGVLGLALIAAAGVAWLGVATVGSALLGGTLLAGAAVVAAVVLVCWADRLPGISRLPPRFAAVGAWARDARAVCVAPAHALPLLLLSTLNVFLATAASWLIVRGLGIPLPLLDCVILMTVVTLITVVPVSFAGWGLREAATVAVLGTVGVPQPQALAASLLFGAVMSVGALPGAIAWLALRARTAAGSTAK